MNMNEPPSLLRNDVDPKQHWIKVKLEGVKSNRSAIGARVIAHYGDKKAGAAVVSQSSYYSCNDPRLHFGLGLPRQLTSKCSGRMACTKFIRECPPINWSPFVRALGGSRIRAGAADSSSRHCLRRNRECGSANDPSYFSRSASIVLFRTLLDVKQCALAVRASVGARDAGEVADSTKIRVARSTGHPPGLPATEASRAPFRRRACAQ